jgi:hypothetical protein
MSVDRSEFSVTVVSSEFSLQLSVSDDPWISLINGFGVLSCLLSCRLDQDRAALLVSSRHRHAGGTWK